MLYVVWVWVWVRGRVVRRGGVVRLHASLVDTFLVAHVAHSTHHAHHSGISLNRVVLYGVHRRWVWDVWQGDHRLFHHTLSLACAAVANVRTARLAVRVTTVVRALVAHIVIVLVLVVVGILIAVLVAASALESGPEQRSLAVALGLVVERRLVVVGRGLVLVVVGRVVRALGQRHVRQLVRQLARRVVARRPVRGPHALHAQVVVEAQRGDVVHGQVGAVGLHALEHVRVDAGRRRRRHVRVRRRGRVRQASAPGRAPAPHHALHAAHVGRARPARAHARHGAHACHRVPVASHASSSRIHHVGIGGQRVCGGRCGGPH